MMMASSSIWGALLLLLMLDCCYKSVALDHASFYGGSSIAIPLREAKSSTDIHFKFRTHLPNALILLVAGQIDHCIVGLVNGKLRVNINLGAGESELFSAHGVRLNDLQWHDVFIVRKEGDLSMIVDNAFKYRTHLAGDFFELNIHYGLFVGGQCNRTDLFYGHMENFRGCLSEVMYNGILVLDQARHRQSAAIVNGVTWNCAAEFDAPADRAISFVEDGAYMTLSQSVAHALKLQLDFRTMVAHGVLVYNSGPVAKPDLFALEVWQGKLKVSFKHGDKVQEAMGDTRVDDGEWHKVALKLSGTALDVNVDGKAKQLRLARGHLMDFTETFYVGGVELSKRARAMSKGLQTADTSFKGCLRYLAIGDKAKGLPDVHVSEGLLPGCVWQYPCLQKTSPCGVGGGECRQQGVDSFRCQSNNNTSDDQRVVVHSNFATDLELLALEPLEALEGQSVRLSPANLHMVLDYPKFGIRDAGIKFQVVEAPVHGSITIDVWPNDNTFTLADIARDKVHYLHDGSESLEDHIGLEVEFTASDLFILPAYLQGKFRFHLQVNVAPVNDPPVVKTNANTVLRVPQGAKTTIDADMLRVIDPDSNAKHLVFSVLDAGAGHFEYVHKPAVPIVSFTRIDIEHHEVLYVHHTNAANESHVALQVSDGIATSAPVKVRVSAFPQFWRLQNNTGVVLMHLTSTLITPFNLSFVSNVANASESAQFFIEQGPQYGVVEVEKDVGFWENSVIFTSDDIRQHRVRYRHITSRPEVDEFQFRTTLNKTMLYTFRMTFAKCRLYAVHQQQAKMTNHSEMRITLEHLQYQTEPVASLFTSVQYKILAPPLYGFLYSAVSKYRMRVDDVFSQEDIALGNVNYQLHRKGYSRITDHVELMVAAPGCQNITTNLSLEYTPDEEVLKRVRGKITLVRLQVEEGSSTSVYTTHLNIETMDVMELVFNITEPPKHGYLLVTKGGVLRNVTTYFTLGELRNDYLSYTHDDSETREDGFTFMALSSESADFEYVDRLHIDIALKNDNSPTRIVDRTFNVVVGGSRLLTAQDLAYADIDLDTKPAEIVYTFKELPNGEFFAAHTNGAKLTEFTQADLDERRVLFKHRGPEYGKIKFWVTDGPYYVSGVLEVQASAPFIRPVLNRRLVVQHGRTASLTVEHLTYNTNLYATDDDVIYQLTAKPNFGQIVFSDSGKTCYEFTQSHVNKGAVAYRNDITTSSADEIGLKVICRDASNVAQVSVLMLPASYWEPLHVKTLRQLTVEESTSAIISKSIVEIIQPQVPATAITYHIATLPENGYLTILPPAGANHGGEDQTSNVRTFTQAFLNEHRVIYIQSVANETRDRIVFNVTNGMVWLYGLALDIQIIPERLYLGSNILNVNEGGTSVITNVHLYVATDYYKTRVTDYVILEEPAYGCIQVHKRCNKLHGFSQKELSSGLIQYAHNGSENQNDGLVLIAVAGEKRSIPVVLTIKVIPINDQRPRVVNNTGLVMWEGGSAVITHEMLAAVDADRPQETLKYQVISAWWGNVSLVSDPTAALRFFTQELVDRAMVVFRHQNGTDAKFTFNVSDGLHSTKEYTFNVRTKEVTLTLQHRPLHIFPLQRKFITASHLLARVSDPERTVWFEVSVGPTLGRLMMESEKAAGIFNVVSRFTQLDLNNSRVFYEHIHPFAGLYANDSFVFNVRSHLAEPLINKKMKIDISVSSGGLDAYVSIPKIAVDEGGMTNVVLNFSGVVAFLEQHAGLRAPVIHAAVEAPQHGQIFLQNPSSVVANLSSTFSQQQLESGDVKYQHDHSDSLGDNLYCSLYLIPGYILLCNLTVPIRINPINDQPFQLVTPAPHLVVVQGENHTITKSELCTEDIDTAPGDLLYDIISGPQEGRIVLMPERIAINHFSQADVDAGRLMYIHNSSALTDTFHLRVWDGKFRPEYTVFNVQALPVRLNATQGLPVYIQQGMNVVLLSPKQFVVETNTSPRRVAYRITTPPRHGVLFVRDTSAEEFTQDDLDNDRVMYMQRDMTTANDTMTIYVGILHGNISIGDEIQVHIKVQPLMQLGNCTVLTGEVNKLSLHVLDATPLAKLTNSNPRYTITCQPQFGELRKIIRSSGEQRNVLNTLITGFSHEEVQSGLIYIAIRDIEVGWNAVMDRFCFVLAAPIFQPAVGELKLVIRSPLHNDIYSTLPGPNDPAGHEGGLHFASPNMTRDYFLIVSMVAGVVILGVAVIIFIKCRAYDEEELKQDALMQQALPRPPDRLLSASPPPLKHAGDGYAASPIASTTLPHCKVTPISRSEMEVPGGGCARYPYGVADEHSADEWSSCDTTTDGGHPARNNIMLRRNQYWV